MGKWQIARLPGKIRDFYKKNIFFSKIYFQKKKIKKNKSLFRQFCPAISFCLAICHFPIQNQRFYDILSGNWLAIGWQFSFLEWQFRFLPGNFIIIIKICISVSIYIFSKCIPSFIFLYHS